MLRLYNETSSLWLLAIRKYESINWQSIWGHELRRTF